MTWTLDPSTNGKEVAWRREEDGVIVAFAREGLGEPSSTDKAPPDNIDKYAEPLKEIEAPAIPGEKERSDALKAIERIRAELEVLTALLLQ